MLDLFEARLGIEVLAAKFAAARRTEEDLESIERSLKILVARIEAGESTLGVSLDFHAAIIAASHNSVLVEMNLYLADWLKIARERFQEFKSPDGHGIEEHERILVAIKTKDEEGAAEQMRSHLTKTIDVVRRAIASTSGMQQSSGEQDTVRRRG
jgi:DNA-binding FadR family transcriptional regulator